MNCSECIEERVNSNETFISEDVSDRPWQKVGLDLLKYESWFLIATDYYSRFPEVLPLNYLTEESAVEKCKVLFAEQRRCQRAVKTVKDIIKKTNDMNLGLLAYRAAPLNNGYALAELMFSMRIRTHVPMVPSQLNSCWNHEDVAQI